MRSAIIASAIALVLGAAFTTTQVLADGVKDAVEGLERQGNDRPGNKNADRINREVEASEKPTKEASPTPSEKKDPSKN